MMLYLFKRPFFKWLLACLGSIFLHILVGYYYFFKVEIPPSQLTASAVIVEFSDPPQSIFMPTELPIGPPQQISEESMPEPRQVEPDLIESDLELAVEEPTPPEVKPEIIVEQKPKETSKPKDNIKKKERNKPLKDKVKPKEPLQDSQIVKKPKPNTEKRKNGLSDKVLSSGSNVATAAPSGTSNRIAAELNSVSQGQNSELNWRSLVKAHLQRNLRYPEQALKKRWKGVAIINIILDSQSNVVSVKLLKSSGKDSFDREAIENAKRSSPLPVPPAHLRTQTTISIDVPVSFDYERYRK